MAQWINQSQPYQMDAPIAHIWIADKSAFRSGFLQVSLVGHIQLEKRLADKKRAPDYKYVRQQRFEKQGTKCCLGRPVFNWKMCHGDGAYYGKHSISQVSVWNEVFNHKHGAYSQNADDPGNKWDEIGWIRIQSMDSDM